MASRQILCEHQVTSLVDLPSLKPAIRVHYHVLEALDRLRVEAMGRSDAAAGAAGQRRSQCMPSQPLLCPSVRGPMVHQALNGYHVAQIGPDWACMICLDFSNDYFLCFPQF